MGERGGGVRGRGGGFIRDQEEYPACLRRTGFLLELLEFFHDLD